MKLKKLLNTMSPHQAVSFVATKCGVTRHSEVIRLDSGYSIQSIGDCKVISIRSVHDEFQLPDWQDYIEIKIQPIEEELE